MQVIASVLGEKRALENIHEKACTEVHVKLHKKNATTCLPCFDFKRINKRGGKATHLPLP